LQPAYIEDAAVQAVTVSYAVILPDEFMAEQGYSGKVDIEQQRCQDAALLNSYFNFM